MINCVCIYPITNNSSGKDVHDLFSQANHLNAARKLIPSPTALTNLRKLNYRAGTAAKVAGAHESALKYFKAGCRLIRPEEWTNDYAQVFPLSLAYAGTEYFSYIFNSQASQNANICREIVE